MSESIFASIMEEYADLECAKYADAPEHKFSLKHRLAMKRIFKRWERNTQYLRSDYAQKTLSEKFRPAPKRLLMILVIILLAMIAGCSIAYVTRGFNIEVQGGHTVLTVINAEDCPMVIEDKYYLSKVPNGFEIHTDRTNPCSKIMLYENEQTGQTIKFNQICKSLFASQTYYTGEYGFVEIEVNGHSGVLQEWIGNECNVTYILLDIGDYILESESTLPKDELLDLVKSAKLLEI